jgi:tetraacyldisaccharide 4'-kinase
MSSLVDRLWYSQNRPLGFLAPLAWLYRRIAALRRRKALKDRSPALTAPVVVVGNITAGGTGKSPLTAWIVTQLRNAGWHPVILSRGYGGKSEQYPLFVNADSNARIAGDEPVMLARATGCPVVVDPQRLRAAHYAIDQRLGDVLVCDDGLQHYALPRDIELAVFDASRGLGNGASIPVGPLREPADRLNSVDYIILNGSTGKDTRRQKQFAGVPHRSIYTMNLSPLYLLHLASGARVPLAKLAGQNLLAVAGIGNPARFFATLSSMGAQVRPRAFADHHRFKPSDLKTRTGEWLVMTAKDAVKCQDFAPDNAYALMIEAQLPAEFGRRLLSQLARWRQLHPIKSSPLVAASVATERDHHHG